MQLPSFDPTNNESLTSLLESMSTNAGKIQRRVLEEILAHNAETEYLRGFLDRGSSQPYPTDPKQLFNDRVPLVDYQDILPFIQRIANGEPHHIISAHPITELVNSSGTSGGKQKWFPRTAQEPIRDAFYLKLGHSILNKHIDEPLHQGKRMFLRFLAPDVTTPGGLVVRSGVSSQLKNDLLRNSSLNSSTSPDEVTLCEDLKQSMYSHLLCGLVRRDSVVILGTVFASGFLRLIKFLEQHWKELCSNIRTGHISDWITDPKCRRAVSCILSEPMPNLADSIQNECEKKSWEGIIKKIWPVTKCIEAVITGSMAQYIPKLVYYCGGVPLVSLFYASSEGCFGINLKPLSDPYNVTYCLIPWMAYYEFLPINDQRTSEEANDDHQKGSSSEPDFMAIKKKDGDGLDAGVLVDLANVKIGQHYELVVTTFSGLYRYRLGDILRVTDFYNNAPQFKFVSRRNVILSIESDKTTEEDLLEAVSKAMRNILEPLGFLLTDYTSYVDLSSFPGHYVLFWELQNDGDEAVLFDASKMEQCCNVVDESLDMTYKDWRRSNAIGPLEIRVVKQGTFDALMDFSISQLGTSFSQYKTPKCIKSENAIQLLNSMVVATFFSQVMSSS